MWETVVQNVKRSRGSYDWFGSIFEVGFKLDIKVYWNKGESLEWKAGLTTAERRWERMKILLWY